ncbi:MAG TPA: DUF4129 domain-containing protein, partial [Planctomycetota bacterium]|nr:DUF4129 domain-containing protein [Planctomycetota bacterium]
RPEAPKLPELEEGSWISRFLRWLFGDGESRSSERATTTSSFAWGFILRLIAALLIIATLLVITLGIVRARPGEKEAKNVDPAAPEEDPELSGPPGERPPDWWLGQAAREADHGMYRRAIGLVLLASRSSLERDGKIHYRQGLTNRDYLRAARGDPRVARALSSITVHSELVIYGRRSATRERYSECVRLFEEGFLHAPERV